MRQGAAVAVEWQWQCWDRGRGVVSQFEIPADIDICCFVNQWSTLIVYTTHLLGGQVQCLRGHRGSGVQLELARLQCMCAGSPPARSKKPTSRLRQILGTPAQADERVRPVKLAPLRSHLNVGLK